MKKLFIVMILIGILAAWLNVNAYADCCCLPYKGKCLVRCECPTEPEPQPIDPGGPRG